VELRLEDSGYSLLLVLAEREVYSEVVTLASRSG